VLAGEHAARVVKVAAPVAPASPNVTPAAPSQQGN